VEKERILTMRPEIIISSVVVALVFLPLLAWKWRIGVKMAVYGAVIIGAVSGFLVNWIDSAMPGLHMAALVVIELCFILVISALIIASRFYRDPERYPSEREGVIMSPADGMVVYVNEIDKNSSLVSTKGKRKYPLTELTNTDLLKNAHYLVGIDMNIFNVHVNRSPIKGKIVLCKRTKGKFISLRCEESPVVNERVTTVISNGKFKVGVVQISSRLVRKILSYIKEGEKLDIGQRLGAIVFGSQVDTIIPELDDLRIEVKPGDELKAGISVIARFRHEKSGLESSHEESNDQTA
jgi:phosphatidylserine decarboxylase